jgi:hypothetical protein
MSGRSVAPDEPKTATGESVDGAGARTSCGRRLVVVPLSCPCSGTACATSEASPCLDCGLPRSCYAPSVARCLARALAVVAALTTVCALPGAASAQPQASVTRERVRGMLSGIEDVPTDADWRRLGEQVLPVLMDLYADVQEAPFVRLRALGATAAFPRPSTRAFLLGVARVDGQSDLVIREALLALARGFGRDAGRDLAGYLGHAEPVVREAAAIALGRVGGAEAQRHLSQRLPVERDVAVREAIERGLTNAR